MVCNFFYIFFLNLLPLFFSVNTPLSTSNYPPTSHHHLLPPPTTSVLLLHHNKSSPTSTSTPTPPHPPPPPPLFSSSTYYHLRLPPPHNKSPPSHLHPPPLSSSSLPLSSLPFRPSRSSFLHPPTPLDLPLLHPRLRLHFWAKKFNFFKSCGYEAENGA